MRIIFSLNPAVAPGKEQELIALVTSRLPGASAQVDPAGMRMLVVLPIGTDPFAASETVRYTLRELGYDAREIERLAPQYTQAPPMYPPMYPPMQKKPRTVRLSTFLISLISAILVVALLSFSLAAVVFSAVPGLLYSDSLGNMENKGEDYIGKISLIDQIFSEYSLYDIDGDLMLDSMLKAYAAATGDRYAAYYTAEEFAALMADNNAEAVGIGITVVENLDPDGFMIVSVLPDSPAMAAGVAPGDLLIAVKSGDAVITVEDDGFDRVYAALGGGEGTVAEFTVRRGSETLDFSVTRARLQTRSVEARVHSADPTVGVVRIMQFDLSTPQQFEAAMEALIGEGCTRFVFDVRNNPGGDLQSVNAVLSFFLNEGDLIVSTSQKDGTTTYYHNNPADYDGDYAGCSVKKEKIGKYRNYKNAVLVNGNTASAAELFTAALADYDLTTVVGETTFGKGILQQVYSLEPLGYEGGIKLTTGYYSPPSGVNYHDKGITPDVAASLEGEAANKNVYLLTDSEDTQLTAAINALQSL